MGRNLPKDQSKRGSKYLIFLGKWKVIFWAYFSRENMSREDFFNAASKQLLFLLRCEVISWERLSRENLFNSVSKQLLFSRKWEVISLENLFREDLPNVFLHALLFFKVESDYLARIVLEELSNGALQQLLFF